MATDFLVDRKAGLENAFFAQQDAILLRRLSALDETQTQKAALSEVSGIKSDAVLDSLLAQNVTSAALVALSLVPLVVVAWADGSLDDRERKAILSSAKQLGLDKEHASYLLFEGWLARKPPPELVGAWKEYVSALSMTLPDEARQALQSEIIGRARAVAEVSGGLMGMGQKVSSAEAAALGELERIFHVPQADIAMGAAGKRALG